MSILEVNDNFTFSKEVNGPLLATTVVVELFFALSINLFVLIFTLCHPKSLKQPSIIFLTNFVLVNLVTATLIMPSIVVTAVYEEWIFGETVEGKNSTCQFIGFMSVCVGYLTFMTIGIISVDRFLFIVKPLVHKRVMKTWVAVGIVLFLWILSCLLNIPPFFGLGSVYLSVFYWYMFFKVVKSKTNLLLCVVNNHYSSYLGNNTVDILLHKKVHQTNQGSDCDF